MLFGLAATGMGWAMTMNIVRGTCQTTCLSVANQAIDGFERELFRYELLLRGVRVGCASSETVSEEEWLTCLGELGADEQPDIATFAIVERVNLNGRKESQYLLTRVAGNMSLRPGQDVVQYSAIMGAINASRDLHKGVSPPSDAIVAGAQIAVIAMPMMKATSEHESWAICLVDVKRVFQNVSSIHKGTIGFILRERRSDGPPREIAVAGMASGLESVDTQTIHFDLMGRPFELFATLMRDKSLGTVRYEPILVLVGGITATLLLVGFYLSLTSAAIRHANMCDAAEAASRSKTEFLANMSHEIRTPMTAILGYADLLHDPQATPENRISAVHTIRRSGDHLLTIINDILDISKIEAGKMKVERIECSPVRIIEDVFSLMHERAATKGIELKIDYEFPLPRTIESDPVRIRQILVNLVGNAVKFTETGGVRLGARFENSGDEDGVLTLEVEDTGVGMSPDQTASVFRAFEQADTSTTRRFGGTGLGLTITKRLSEMLGGKIDVRSKLGEGSVFTVSIRTGPAHVNGLLSSAEQIGQAESAKRSSERVQASGALDVRVLLAEDGPDNQRLITFHLKNAGAFVEIAPNGRIALERATAAADSGKPFDLVLMDMQMPEMDGYTATSLLRARGLDTPIIALTAHAMSGDRDKCLLAGCDDYATKPIDKEKLISLCREWATKRSGRVVGPDAEAA